MGGRSRTRTPLPCVSGDTAQGRSHNCEKSVESSPLSVVPHSNGIGYAQNGCAKGVRKGPPERLRTLERYRRCAKDLRRRRARWAQFAVEVRRDTDQQRFVFHSIAVDIKTAFSPAFRPCEVGAGHGK